MKFTVKYRARILLFCMQMSKCDTGDCTLGISSIISTVHTASMISDSRIIH